MLLINNIYFYRNNIKILENISISISPKKIIHLRGNNGVGKTTLLKIISNILEPKEGNIFWNGKNIKKITYEYYKDLTFIMDSQTSNSDLTVYENISFWCNLFSSSIKNNEISSLLDLFNLQKYKNVHVNYLSYGEKKKLELLRLVIEQKKLWILDEPFMGLDTHSIDIINQTIINHAQQSGMVIFTSHNVPDIPNLEIFDLKNDA